MKSNKCENADDLVDGESEMKIDNVNAVENDAFIEDGDKKVTQLKQTILDAYFPTASSCSASASHPRSNGFKQNHGRKPSSIIFSVTKAKVSETHSVRKYGQKAQPVVEEVSDQSVVGCESRRLSAIIETARAKQRRCSLDNYWQAKSSVPKEVSSRASEIRIPDQVVLSTKSSDKMQKDDGVKNDMDSLRCYDNMYPDLNMIGDSDTILVSVTSLKEGVVPKSFPQYCADPTYSWNHGQRYVRMPLSTCNTDAMNQRYQIIKKSISQLLEPLHHHKQIERCIRNYSRFERFDALNELFNAVLEKELIRRYLVDVIPFMAKLVIQTSEIITQPIPILKQGVNSSLTISQYQASALLANAFFCTFPCRGTISNDLPMINFGRLFSLRTRNSIEKLRCLLHYFSEIHKELPTGLLTFRRQCSKMPNWSSLTLPLSHLFVQSNGRIEDDGHGMLQVDFANKYIGGGVLADGCVQEEIRFLICPEMIVSMIICEKMKSFEAIVICGAQRFSNYTGYGSTFAWCPLQEKQAVPRDRFERLCCEVVAIDALDIEGSMHQFEVKFVNRELHKAYVGFLALDCSTKPVATGNWGCGVFGGNFYLKSLIQMMASSANERPMCYFTFKNDKFAAEFSSLYEFLRHRNVTVGQLYRVIVQYCLIYGVSSLPLYDFVRQQIESQLKQQVQSE